MTKLKYTIETEITEDNKIIQTTKLNNELTEKTEEITKTIYDLRELGLRNALIRLGWTPPRKN